MKLFTQQADTQVEMIQESLIIASQEMTQAEAPAQAQWGQLFNPGQKDGIHGPLTERALEAMRQASLVTDLVADMPEPVARAAAQTAGSRSGIQLGPHRVDSVLECRPYFLAPLGDEKLEAQRMAVKAAIASEASKGTITDVFVLSHGWHRNFFGAVEAYDRLMSRFTGLFRRGRLPLPNSGQPFRPMFLTLHWNSDPGSDDFEDRGGKRSRDDFLANVRASFTRVDPATTTEGQMLTDFEALFEFLSHASAPGVDTLGDGMEKRAGELMPLLDKYDLRYSQFTPATSMEQQRPEKSAALWTCYHESAKRPESSDQEAKAGPWLSICEAILGAISFVAGLAGVLTVLGYVARIDVFKNFVDRIVEVLVGGSLGVFGTIKVLLPEATGSWLNVMGWQSVAWVITWGVLGLLTLGAPMSVLSSLAVLRGGRKKIDLTVGGVLWCAASYWLISTFQLEDAGQRPTVNVAALWVQNTLAASSIGSLVILAASALVKRKHPPAATRVPMLELFFFVQMMVLVFVPLLGFLLASMILFGPACTVLNLIPGVRIRRLLGMSDERWGRRTANSTGEMKRPRTLFFRQKLAAPTLWAIDLLQQAVGKHVRAIQFADLLKNQAAFWEMQAKGVTAGMEGADFLRSICNDTPALQRARFHLVGHSFGGLVVSNLVRSLSRDEQANRLNLHSVVLLNAAIGSAWYEQEDAIVDAVQGSIANLYTVNDSANGFYFPTANAGKMAAGNRGLSGAARDNMTTRCRFTATTNPPNLFDKAYSKCAVCSSGACDLPDLQADQSRVDGKPHLLNLDASRIMYAGPIASGGAHTDIFKDDVVHLIWSAITLPPKR